MIKGKVTTEQKKLFNLIRKANSQIKKAIKPLAKKKLAQVKQDAPKDTGALRKSLATRLIAKGGKSAGIVVGPRTTWSQTSPDGDIRVPNKYAKKIDDATGFLSDNITKADVDEIQKAIKDTVKGML